MNHFNLTRLVLSLLVIVSHSHEIKFGGRHGEPLAMLVGRHSLGEIAVNGFFMVSGLLITSSWFKSVSPMDYIRKRLLRILPAFVVCYGLSVLLFGPMAARVTGAAYWSEMSGLEAAWGLLTLNQPQTPPVFIGTAFPGVNVSLWSIRYEFVCYTMVAALGMVGALNRRFSVVLFALFLVAFLAGVAAKDGLLDARLAVLSKAFVRLPMFFLAGSLLHWSPNLLRAFQRPLAWASCLGITLACLALPVWGELVTATVGTCGLLGFASSLRAGPRRWYDTTDVSYGLYLYAWPISQFLYLAAPDQSAWVNSLATILLALAAGWGSWVIVEKPFMRMKFRRADA
jgi:peptidoglycan/LPS O-acetylase OafA/YrhL